MLERRMTRPSFEHDAFASLFIALLLAGCASSSHADARKREAMVDAQLGATRVSLPIASLAHKVPLAPGEKFKIAELGRDQNSSHHVVALLDREPLHRHDTHDLLVFVLEGEGEMLIGSETKPIGAHSV